MPVCRSSLYPNARRNLLAIRGLVGTRRHRPARIVLSVRDYATWWPSAYALLGIRRDMPAIESMVPGWMVAQRRWPDVVTDVLAVFGQCDVVCYEALSVDPLILAKALVGEAAGAATEFRLQPSCSGAGLNTIKAKRTTNKPPPPDIMHEIHREDHGRPRLAPFSADQLANLSMRYHNDLTRMKEIGANIVVPPPDWPGQ